MHPCVLLSEVDTPLSPGFPPSNTGACRLSRSIPLQHGRPAATGGTHATTPHRASTITCVSNMQPKCAVPCTSVHVSLLVNRFGDQRRYNNKTSYYFDRELGTCKEMEFPVGILTPDWLANATYLGKETVDTHDTHVWTKSEGFIRYWADVTTGLPVSLPSSFPPACERRTSSIFRHRHSGHP